MQARYSASEIMLDRDIVSEVMAHMVAGSDTTTISLSLLERVVPSPASKTVSPASPSTPWATQSRPAPPSPPRLGP
ncbi:hypothetical protein FIBSPDRAFT_873433 [Athelia psychrophila]|uniref:Cytochrome P450 n=1 Tax=Athelia psychrophila TaxID=1759441 RepID=A0A165YMP5_9AGAM|nr:hypothetical protein FIBSPDRAFT_873433 [Fibularhizoctonia sp. CBS 109695]